MTASFVSNTHDVSSRHGAALGNSARMTGGEFSSEDINRNSSPERITLFGQLLLSKQGLRYLFDVIQHVSLNRILELFTTMFRNHAIVGEAHHDEGGQVTAAHVIRLIGAVPQGFPRSPGSE